MSKIEKAEKVNASGWFQNYLESQVRSFIREYLKKQEANQALYPNRMTNDDWTMAFISWYIDRKAKDNSTLLVEFLSQRR